MVRGATREATTFACNCCHEIFEMRHAQNLNAVICAFDDQMPTNPREHVHIHAQMFGHALCP